MATWQIVLLSIWAVTAVLAVLLVRGAKQQMQDWADQEDAQIRADCIFPN
jgi:hypothetical protein